MPVREVDVRLVEDGAPLEGRAVQLLAGQAVAVLAVERLLARELVLHAAAVAGAAVAGLEVLRRVVDGVGGAMLPGIKLSFGGAVVAVVAVGGVGGGGHVFAVRGLLEGDSDSSLAKSGCVVVGN